MLAKDGRVVDTYDLRHRKRTRLPSDALTEGGQGCGLKALRRTASEKEGGVIEARLELNVKPKGDPPPLGLDPNRERAGLYFIANMHGVLLGAENFGEGVVEQVAIDDLDDETLRTASRDAVRAVGEGQSVPG